MDQETKSRWPDVEAKMAQLRADLRDWKNDKSKPFPKFEAAYPSAESVQQARRERSVWRRVLRRIGFQT